MRNLMIPLVAALMVVMLVAMAVPAFAQANDTSAGCGILYGTGDIAPAARGLNPDIARPFGKNHVSQFAPGTLGPIIRGQTAQGCAGTH